MDWLPELIPLSRYSGNFARYLEALYGIFRRDFVHTQPIYRGRRCYCDARPDGEDGRECGFWHIVTEGKSETDRTPSLRRCERIAWPRAIIEAADTSLVRKWESSRKRPGKGRQTRLSMAPSDFSYLVVLRPTSSAYVLVTAFYLESERQREKKRKEYEEAS